MKYWLLFFSLFSCNLFANDSISFNNPGNNIFDGETNKSLQIYFESPSGDGKTQATSGITYIPMETMLSTLAASQSNYYKDNVGGVSTHLFGYNSTKDSIDNVTVIGNSGETTLRNYYFSFPIKVPLNKLLIFGETLSFASYSRVQMKAIFLLSNCSAIYENSATGFESPML